MKKIFGGVMSAKGFYSAGVSVGITASLKKDMGIIYTEKPAVASAVFTSNNVKAAPVIVSMERINNLISAVVVNSGNANCLTGQAGLKDAKRMVELVEKFMNLKKGSVLVASTGIIGKRLPMQKIEIGIKRLVERINFKDWSDDAFAEAIMTTDKRKKKTAYEVELNDGRKFIIGGTAKGAGMICPNMATMLAFIATDAVVDKEFLDRSLKKAVDNSFNHIDIDGEQSTNDMVFLLANGVSGVELKTNEDKNRFYEALETVCVELAKMIVEDGEGATKFVQIEVKNAHSKKDATKLARLLAHSPLVKTAIFGAQGNWGRFVNVIGYSGVKFELSKVELVVNGYTVFKNGIINTDASISASHSLRGKNVEIEVYLNEGNSSDFVWTTDLSPEYIRINAEYT